MKISDFRNEEAIDLLADIIEPSALILGDADTRKAIADVKDGKLTKIKAISKVLKKHKGHIIEILARLDGKEPEDYTCNVLVLPQKVLEILNDKELIDFFTLQVQEMESESFGLPTENTEGIEK